MTNRKALKILLDLYWSTRGWKYKHIISAEDFFYARTAGLMFDPALLTHQSVIARVRAAAKALDPVQVGSAFLASLSSRRLELRSALGSYAVARHFPEHEYHELAYNCFICGWHRSLFPLVDQNVLNFERYKWGGVRHENPEYIAFDLEQFAKVEPSKPTVEDIEIMNHILLIVRQCEPDMQASDLVKRLAGKFKSNKAERQAMLQILGYCGILQREDFPGYFKSFVFHDDRKTRSSYWTYPICWWRGVDGISQDVLEFYFPQLA